MMPLTVLAGGLLAGAFWGLGMAVLLAALPGSARIGPSPHVIMQASRVLGIAASLALAACGAFGLAGVIPAPLEWWPGLPGDPFRIECDALAAPFLLLLGILGAAAFACTPIPAALSAGTRARSALLAGFTLALAATFAAQHALLFLLAWEGMTLLSAALVASDTRSARARSATFVYLALSHAGTVLIAFGLLQLTTLAGSFAFGDLAEGLFRAPAGSVDTTLWLLSIGFAVKLGVAPFHVWLPLAHPEAPGPVSALMSGVMITAGLYGLLRFAWQIPGAPPSGWGEALMIAGILTALIGALYATLDADAKRVLAFSTVKHAGLMTLAVGLAATFERHGQPLLATVALAGAFYHVIGHGLAKGLGFLAVAEATHAAGSRDLEMLGGLARRMPRVSIAAFVATLALCGMPLLSCFAGEWLLFQSLILGYSGGDGSLRLLAPFAGGGLALASALACAALVKLYGIGFLGRARSDGARAAQPVSPVIEWSLLALAVTVLAWGLASPFAIASLGEPLAAVLGAETDGHLLIGSGGFTLCIPPDAFASISPMAVAVLIALFVLLAFAWGTARGLRHAARRAPPWAGGIALTPRMQYSALGFTKPLRLIFAPLLRAENELEVLEAGAPGSGPAHVANRAAAPLVERVLYQPVVRVVLWASDQARRLQSGSLPLYLAYLLITLIVLLLWARE